MLLQRKQQYLNVSPRQNLGGTANGDAALLALLQRLAVRVKLELRDVVGGRGETSVVLAASRARESFCG